MRRLVCLSILAASSPAAADAWSLHVTGDARVGWTDNLFSTTDNRSSDVYTQLEPGALFTWESPRNVDELSYVFQANLFASHSEAWSITHRGQWRGYFQISPLSELESNVQVAGGTLNTFTTQATAATGEVTLLPSAESTFEAVDGRETWMDQLSRDWRLTQSGIGRVFSAKASTSGVRNTGAEVGGGLGIDRSWQYTAIGADAKTSYIALGGGASEQLSSLTAKWRRDLGDRWSTMIDGGAVMLTPLAGANGIGTSFEPTVGAQVGYYPVWGSAGLQVRRGIVPNLYIGATTITDSATLNAGLPVHWLGDDRNGAPRLGFDATIGYARSSIIDRATGDQFGGFQVASGDVAVSYGIAPQAHLSLRYQLVHQVAGTPMVNGIDVHSYDRNTVLLSFDGRWPERVAGEVPQRDSLRVNRSDVTPVGEEITATPEGTRPRQ